MSRAIKHNDNKTRYSLLTDDMKDEVEDIVRVLMLGAQKYGRKNWQGEMEDANFFLDAVERHIVAHRKGILLDSESGRPHLAHACCGLLFTLWHATHDNAQDPQQEEDVIETLLNARISDLEQIYDELDNRLNKTLIENAELEEKWERLNRENEDLTAKYGTLLARENSETLLING